MRKPPRSLTFLLALLALVPVLSAGRPACCFAVKQAARACCAAMAASMPSAPNGCCKVPATPKPESKVSDGAPVALATPAIDPVGPAIASSTLPASAAIRIARRAHHAETPDDTPPDLLDRLHVLLI